MSLQRTQSWALDNGIHRDRPPGRTTVDAPGHLGVIVGGPMTAIGRADGLAWVVMAWAGQTASQCFQAMQCSSLVGNGTSHGSVGLVMGR